MARNRTECKHDFISGGEKNIPENAIGVLHPWGCASYDGLCGSQITESYLGSASYLHRS